MKQLYKDEKFELNLKIEGVELKINGTQYILSSHPYEPCTYIKTLDGSVDIAMHDAYDLGILFINECWNCASLSPKEFCEEIESTILKNKSKKKQQIVQETGYKTATNLDVM